MICKEEIAEQFVVLADPGLYRAGTGLSLDDPTFHRVEGLVW